MSRSTPSPRSASRWKRRRRRSRARGRLSRRPPSRARPRHGNPSTARLSRLNESASNNSSSRSPHSARSSPNTSGRRFRTSPVRAWNGLQRGRSSLNGPATKTPRRGRLIPLIASKDLTATPTTTHSGRPPARRRRSPTRRAWPASFRRLPGHPSGNGSGPSHTASRWQREPRWRRGCRGRFARGCP